MSRFTKLMEAYPLVDSLTDLKTEFMVCRYVNVLLLCGKLNINKSIFSFQDLFTWDTLIITSLWS